MRILLVHNRHCTVSSALPARTWTVFAHDAASGDLLSVARLGANARIQHLNLTNEPNRAWQSRDAARITCLVTPFQYSAHSQPFWLQAYTARGDGVQHVCKHGLCLWSEWENDDTVSVELGVQERAR